MSLRFEAFFVVSSVGCLTTFSLGSSFFFLSFLLIWGGRGEVRVNCLFWSLSCAFIHSLQSFSRRVFQLSHNEHFTQLNSLNSHTHSHNKHPTIKQNDTYTQTPLHTDTA